MNKTTRKLTDSENKQLLKLLSQDPRIIAINRNRKRYGTLSALEEIILNQIIRETKRELSLCI